MLLLDTHVAVWVARGDELSDATRRQITDARNDNGAFLSAITIWEVGNLLRKGRAGLNISLIAWVQRFRSAGGFREIDLTLQMVVEAAGLPDHFHSDPADRFLVATARHLAIPIITRDRRILAYAKAGHVEAIAC